MLSWFQKFYERKEEKENPFACKEKNKRISSAFVDVHFYYRKSDSECCPSGILVRPSNKIYEESEFL